MGAAAGRERALSALTVTMFAFCPFVDKGDLSAPYPRGADSVWCVAEIVDCATQARQPIIRW
jgi:hypothetical protein